MLLLGAVHRVDGVFEPVQRVVYEARDLRGSVRGRGGRLLHVSDRVPLVVSDLLQQGAVGRPVRELREGRHQALVAAMASANGPVLSDAEL
jgi:hypothetical protein